MRDTLNHICLVQTPPTTRKGNMNLLELDEKILKGHVLPLLHVNALLRLRRVSKLAKTITEDYIKSNGIETTREIKTNFRNISSGNNKTDDQFKHFLDRCCVVTRTATTNNTTTITTTANTAAATPPLSTTPPSLSHLPTCSKIYFPCEDTLNNEVTLLSTPVQNFFQSYGPRITHLRLWRLGIPIFSRQIVQYMEQLQNLRGLVLENVTPWKKFAPQSEEDKESVPMTMMIPSSFKKLKSLSIHQLVTDFESRLECLEFLLRLVEESSNNLEYLSLPWGVLSLYGHSNPAVVLLEAMCFGGSRRGTKLADVDGALIEELMMMSSRHVDGIMDAVVSIKNPYHFVFKMEFPNLESIEILNTSQHCAMPSPGFEKPSWRNLKEIKVCADSERLQSDPLMPWIDSEGPKVETKELWNFLFPGDTQRNNVVKLDISVRSDFCAEVSYPDAKHIYTSCPNLRTLKLRHWNAEEIRGVWKGLPLLEEVCLDNCDGLGDDCFLGDEDDEEIENPAFIDLKNLKKLELLGMEAMGGITDKLFDQVLRHLSLKELHLQSNAPVNSISVEGIQSLLTGKFANFIERFSLDGLQLSGITKEKLKTVEVQFRSAKMI